MQNQILNIFLANGLKGFINDCAVLPQQYLDGNQTMKNPKYITWQRVDRLVMSWFYAFLTFEPVEHIVRFTTALRYAKCSKNDTSCHQLLIL